MLTRRSFLRTAAVGAGATVGLTSMAGCGGKDGGAGDALTFLDWNPVESGTPLANTLDAFRNESGLSLQIQPAPVFAEYETKLLTIMASGKTPDVIRINDDFVAKYSAEGQLLDLNPYIQKAGLQSGDFFDHPFNFPIQPDGKHTAWAIGSRPSMILYNVDLFKEAKIPLPPKRWTDENWKWDDFLAAAKRLTIPGKRFGAMVFGNSAETIYSVNNGGEGIYSPDGKKFTLADPVCAEGIQWVADLTMKHKVQPTWAQVKAGGSNFALSMFANGELAMLGQSLGAVPWLNKNMSKYRWDLAPVPGNVAQKTLGSLVVWAIPAKAKHPEQAWQLLKYFTGPKGTEEFAGKHDLVPASRAAEAKLLQSNGRPPANMQLAIEAVGHAVNENAGPHISRASALYEPQMDLIWNGSKPAAEALGEVRKQVEDALAGNG